MRHRFKVLAIVAFAVISFVFVGASALGLRLDDFRPGIGDPEQAERRIEEGMTKDEVRSRLGSPHGRDDDWVGSPSWT